MNNELTLSLKEYRESAPRPLRQVSLCFLLKDEEVLLAMKKRGFGKGRWNGMGGKPSDGETVEEAVIRETEEEVGVKPLKLRHVATLDFYFPEIPADKDWNQQVLVYLVDEWEGEPEDTEEMRPKWFRKEEIPFSEMWSDDIHWLPLVLTGKKVRGEFMFDKGQGLIDFKVEEL